VIQRIAYHSRVGLDGTGMLVNDAAIFLPTDNSWIIACLNSPANWYYSFRFLPHKKDEALSMDIDKIGQLPIPPVSESIQSFVELAVQKLITVNQGHRQVIGELLDWLHVEFGINKFGQRLANPTNLNSDEFVAEVKKRQPRTAGKLTPAALKVLRSGYDEQIPQLRTLEAEALKLEHELSDLVNQAYGLTPEEVALMWETAPPRMPI